MEWDDATNQGPLKYNNAFSRWLESKPWIIKTSLFFDWFISKFYGVDLMVAAAIMVPGFLIAWAPDEWFDAQTYIFIHGSPTQADIIGNLLMVAAVIIALPRDNTQTALNGMWPFIHDLFAIWAAVGMGLLSSQGIYVGLVFGHIPIVSIGMMIASIMAILFTGLRFHRRKVRKLV